MRKNTTPQIESIGFDAARRQAEEIKGGHIGEVGWVDWRCAQAKMHAISKWWRNTFLDFYDSGKADFAAGVGLRGGKSDSIARVLVADALFIRRTLDPGTTGVLPIMSARKSDADDRLKVLKLILSACGISPENEADGPPALPGGIGGTYRAIANGTTGGGVVSTIDSEGHAIEFRVLPAKKNAAIGYTALGGFCDELDMWPDDNERVNPADAIIDLLRTRTTTQPDAHLYFASTSYVRESAHSRMIAAGDTSAQFVARLGQYGADLDTESRQRLASKIRSTDTRLLTPADPLSPLCPTWVAWPEMAIETCYGRVGEDIGKLLSWYGGRSNEAPRGKGAVQPPTVQELKDMAAMSARLCVTHCDRSSLTMDGGRSNGGFGELKKFPGLSRLDPRYNGPRDGGRGGQSF